MEKTDTLSYKFSAGMTTSQGTSGGFNLTDIEEQWQKIQDAAERRKIQNRNAQRKYRKNLKRRVEDLERQNMYRTYNSGSGSGSASTTSTAPSLSLEQHKKPGTSSSMEEDCLKLETNNSQGMVLRNGLIGAGSENNTPSQEIGNPMNSSSNDWMCPRDQSNPSTIHTLLNQSPDLTRNYMDQASQDHHMQNSTSFIDMSSINDYIHANNTLIEDLEEHLGSPESNSEDNLRMHNLGVYKSQRPRSTPSEFDLTVHMGSNPLHLAAMGGYHEIVSLLVDRGSDINARNNQGWTALHLAAERGQHEVVKVLIEKGADLFSRI